MSTPPVICYPPRSDEKSKQLWKLCRNLVRSANFLFRKTHLATRTEWQSVQHTLPFGKLMCFLSLATPQQVDAVSPKVTQFLKEWMQLKTFWNDEFHGTEIELLFLLDTFYGFPFFHTDIIDFVMMQTNKLELFDIALLLKQRHLTLPSHVVPLTQHAAAVCKRYAPEEDFMNLWVVPCSVWASERCGSVRDYCETVHSSLFFTQNGLKAKHYVGVHDPVHQVTAPLVVTWKPDCIFLCNEADVKSISQCIKQKAFSFCVEPFSRSFVDTNTFVVGPYTFLQTQFDNPLYSYLYLPYQGNEALCEAEKRERYWNVVEDTEYFEMYNPSSLPHLSEYPPYRLDRYADAIMLPLQAKIRGFEIEEETVCFSVPPGISLQRPVRQALQKWHSHSLMPVFRGRVRNHLGEYEIPAWYVLLWKCTTEVRPGCYQGIASAFYRVPMKLHSGIPQAKGMACAGPYGAVKEYAATQSNPVALALAVPLESLLLVDKEAKQKEVFFHSGGSVVLAAYHVKIVGVGEIELKWREGYDILTFLEADPYGNRERQ